MQGLARIDQYATIVFDCDGVLLDSNGIKSNAFYNSVLPYGLQAAQAMLDFHKCNGGISRYKKYEHFFENIIKREIDDECVKNLLAVYSEEVRKGLLTCEVSTAIEKLKRQTPTSRWLIVSGSDQTELRSVLKLRQLSRYFDGGIYGSPDSKDAILTREIENKNIVFPALFIGDSKYDYEASNRAGLDFVFVSGWSEFSGWDLYKKEKGFPSVCKLEQLLIAEC